jgi:malonyl-CoA/methylmalonyl-CoA synthetase
MLTYVWRKVIKYRGWKVPILEVESKIMELTYVSEAVVLAVQVADGASEVGVLIRVEPDQESAMSGRIDLKLLRADLSNRMPAFQMPTVFRLLKIEESVPRTPSGKVIRKGATSLYFSFQAGSGTYSEDVEIWNSGSMIGKAHKAWDWGGLQT